MRDYVRGAVLGTYSFPTNPDAPESYSIVKHKELLPSKFCTEWFFNIARHIPGADEQISKIVADDEEKAASGGGGSGSASGLKS
jgi:hypothetical protein